MSGKVVAAFGVLILVMTGCSGGDSAEDYFADLGEITAVLDAELDDIEGTFNAGLLDINFDSAGADEQFIDLFQASIGGVNAAFGQLVEGLQDLNPPFGLEAPHGRAVDAGLQVLADYESRADQLGAIATVADIDAYAESLSTSAARTRFVEACQELQATADRDGIQVGLNC